MAEIQAFRAGTGFARPNYRRGFLLTKETDDERYGEVIR
jgi:hypothetical protein